MPAISANARLRNVFLQEVAKCLMCLVEAKTAADAIEALDGFLRGLAVAWHAVDIFSGSEIARRVASHRCPRGLPSFVIGMGFLKREDGTYQGTFARTTLVLVKSGRPWAGGRCLVCAAGFEKDSPLNDGATTACIGALVQEALSRVAAFESDARRRVVLDACADRHDDVVAMFDRRGRLVEQYPEEGRASCPPSLFQAVAAQSIGRRSRLPRPIVLSSDGRVFDVRSRWVTSERSLDNRYLLVHARTRPSVPMDVVERLKDYGLSRRESQIAERVFVGQTNRLIADALFISRDTVKTHCRHIFGKLGISRRTEFLRVMGESPPSAPMGATRAPARPAPGDRRRAV
jgi:DNA-binding CsgD family transcriptional regulator